MREEQLCSACSPPSLLLLLLLRHLLLPQALHGLVIREDLCSSADEAAEEPGDEPVAACVGEEGGHSTEYAAGCKRTHVWWAQSKARLLYEAVGTPVLSRRLAAPTLHKLFQRPVVVVGHGRCKHRLWQACRAP